MKYAPWEALLAMVVIAASADAQNPMVRGMNIGFTGRNVIVSGSFGPRYGFGYYPRFYYPAVYYPTYYYPYYPVVPSTVVVVQPVVAFMPAAFPNFPVVPPLDERDDALLMQPKKPAKKQAMPQPPVLNNPPPKMPAPQPQPALAPIPEMDKKAEADRLIKLGKEAFADEEHGRAAERFQQATRLQPDNAEALFLLAQAQFALGKYREAVVSIHAGMKLKPNWPSSKFDLRGLYANNPAELLEQLNSLRQAVGANPQEPALMFLYGYQLWFLGRQDEAKTFFQKAKMMVTDSKPIDQFLQAP